MSKVTQSMDIAQVKPEETQRFTDLALKDIAQQINGKLDFATNFNGKLLSVTFAAANTQVSVAHGLGRVPQGYIITMDDSGVKVFNGTTSNTATTLYLRASGPGTVGLLVY